MPAGDFDSPGDPTAPRNNRDSWARSTSAADSRTAWAFLKERGTAWRSAGVPRPRSILWVDGLRHLSDTLASLERPLVAVTFLFLVAVHFSWELSRLEDRNRALAEEVALLRMAVGPPHSPADDERDSNRA